MSKEQDEFWNDDLVKEFYVEWFEYKNARASFAECLESFKSRKQPKSLEWEIVSFKKGDQILALSNGKYRNDLNAIGLENCFALGLPIHSVKRLSDNFIIVLHDTKVVDPNTGHEWVVSEITIKNNSCYLNGVNLNHVHAPVKPLFVTEDGVEKYKGDSCFSVRVDSDYGIHNFTKIDVENIFSVWKYFHDKEKAEEYILLHNPCLSVSDVKNISWFYPIQNTKDAHAFNLSNLEKLAKEKINGKQ